MMSYTPNNTLIDWHSLSASEKKQALARPNAQIDKQNAIRNTVNTLFQNVRDNGDEALRHYSLTFDQCALKQFEVSPEKIQSSAQALSVDLIKAIEDAAQRITQFHQATMLENSAKIETAKGLQLYKLARPIAKVGLYVPAGSAPLPSTALMLSIPATLAGCEEIIMCCPPRRDGSIEPSVLYVASRNPKIRVFALGGAQAIAAMTLGTESVPQVHKIYGPGNAYVNEAKLQASQFNSTIAIDMPAGPSEVLVIADDSARAEFVASDLLSQAEHGPDSQVVFISNQTQLIQDVQVEVKRQAALLNREAIVNQALQFARYIYTPTIEQAIEISNIYAPEHLILSVQNPESYVEAIKNAGSIFLGHYTPESLGDYCSGSNHVLPTNAAASAWSGLQTSSFQKTISVQYADEVGLKNTGPCAMTIAKQEGLLAHAQAIEIRLNYIQSQN